MAFGDLRGTLTGNAASITNPFAVSTGGPVTVAVGDLVVAVIGQQTALTATAVTDNLGNTYTAQNAGTDSGTATGRMFYARVTVAGSLTSVSFATTASANDVAAGAAVFEGPFAASLLDASPANLQDITSPFVCPATGALGQTDEIVVGWAAMNAGVATWAATSPSTLSLTTAIAGIGVVISSRTVTATTSVAPEFTNGTNPTSSVLGTASFRKDTRNVRKFYYNSSDLTNLRTNSDGTGAVTEPSGTGSAAGASIGYVYDSYETGLDVRQITTTRRPILRWDAAKDRYYLEFDGADDCLESVSNTQSINFDEFVLYAAAQEDGHATNIRFFSCRGTGSDDWNSPTSLAVCFESSAFSALIHGNAGADALYPQAPLTAPAPFGIYEMYKMPTTCQLLIGGTVGATDSQFGSWTDSGAGGYLIGSGWTGGAESSYLDGRIYSLEFDGTSGMTSGGRAARRTVHNTGGVITGPPPSVVFPPHLIRPRRVIWR